MDRTEFATAVGAAMEEIRSCLASIEAAAQEDDDPALHVLSRGYASLLMPLRDYLSGAAIGRALPRTLAKRLQESLGQLVNSEELIARLELHPNLSELAALVGHAETVA